MKKILVLLAALYVLMPANAEFVDERKASHPVAKPSAGTAVVPTPVEPPPPPPTFEMTRGKRVDDQLRAYGKTAGWDLVWEAPEYMLDRNMTVQGEFEAAVLSFISGANEAGTRLRAIFYRGNKTVRVTEF